MFSLLFIFGFAGLAPAQETELVELVPLKGESKVRMRHTMDMDGMVMNENKNVLPYGCDKIASDVNLTVHAGRKHAAKFNGKIFAYDQQEWAVEPCSRITVKFVNDDHVRHQFMIHGLPDYLYPPMGMFHIELTGPGSKTASFIVPKEKKTYLVHCELTQHMENGMKAQLKVAGGDGDLSSIPGVTGPETPDYYPVDWSTSRILALLAAVGSGIILVLAVGRLSSR